MKEGHESPYTESTLVQQITAEYLEKEPVAL